MGDHRLLEPILGATAEEVEDLDHRALARSVRADEHRGRAGFELDLHVAEELEVLDP